MSHVELHDRFIPRAIDPYRVIRISRFLPDQRHRRNEGVCWEIPVMEGRNPNPIPQFDNILPRNRMGEGGGRGWLTLEQDRRKREVEGLSFCPGVLVGWILGLYDPHPPNIWKHPVITYMCSRWRRHHIAVVMDKIKRELAQRESNKKLDKVDTTPVDAHVTPKIVNILYAYYANLEMYY